MENIKENKENKDIMTAKEIEVYHGLNVFLLKKAIFQLEKTLDNNEKYNKVLEIYNNLPNNTVGGLLDNINNFLKYKRVLSEKPSDLPTEYAVRNIFNNQYTNLINNFRNVCRILELSDFELNAFGLEYVFNIKLRFANNMFKIVSVINGEDIPLFAFNINYYIEESEKLEDDNLKNKIKSLELVNEDVREVKIKDIIIYIINILISNDIINFDSLVDNWNKLNDTDRKSVYICPCCGSNHTHLVENKVQCHNCDWQSYRKYTGFYYLNEVNEKYSYTKEVKYFRKKLEKTNEVNDKISTIEELKDWLWNKCSIKFDGKKKIKPYELTYEQKRRLKLIVTDLDTLSKY